MLQWSFALKPPSAYLSQLNCDYHFPHFPHFTFTSICFSFFSRDVSCECAHFCVCACMPFIFFAQLSCLISLIACAAYISEQPEKKWNANFGIFIHYCECTSWSEIDDNLNIFNVLHFSFLSISMHSHCSMINTVWAAIFFLSFIPFHHICFLYARKLHHCENNIVPFRSPFPPHSSASFYLRISPFRIVHMNSIAKTFWSLISIAIIAFEPSEK